MTIEMRIYYICWIMLVAIEMLIYYIYWVMLVPTNTQEPNRCSIGWSYGRSRDKIELFLHMSRDPVGLKQRLWKVSDVARFPIFQNGWKSKHVKQMRSPFRKPKPLVLVTNANRGLLLWTMHASRERKTKAPGSCTIK